MNKTFLQTPYHKWNDQRFRDVSDWSKSTDLKSEINSARTEEWNAFPQESSYQK